MAAPITRNLTILLTDIKGFTDKTSHKSRVEIQTLLDRHKEIVLPVILGRGGSLVKTMGDAFLATFESPTNAVLAGVEAQAALAAYNVGLKPDDRIEIRVAINQGEVNVVDNDVFGEPVNITARIEAVADAGDVFFTEAIYLAMNKKEVPSSEVGLLQLKGIPEKVRVYRVKAEHPVEKMGTGREYSAERAPEAAAPAAKAAGAAPGAPARSPVVPLVIVALVCAAAASVLFLRGRGAAPSSVSAPAPAVAPSAPSAGSVAARVNSRTYPSTFMGWERPGKRSADPLARVAELARNDLIFSGVSTFHLKWSGAPEGLSEDFAPESVIDALDLRRDVLARNPNAVLLLEIRYPSYDKDSLPPDHPWWLRDAQGARIQAFSPQYFKMDVHSQSFQDHAAAQCRAAVKSGAVDGCFLNAWVDGDDGVSLLKKVRAAAGEDAVLMVSSGRELPLSAPYINGVFVDMASDTSAKAWGWSADALAWASSHLREPRLVAFSVQQDRRRAEILRLATTLSLTHSDGYVLYAQPPGSGDGWSGDRPSFWDKTLGRPLAPGLPRDDGSTSREFEKGTAVYNPPDGKTARLSFSEPRASAATGRKGKTFSLAAGDGDLYLK